MRLFVAALPLAAFVTWFAACGGGDDSSSANDASTSGDDSPFSGDAIADASVDADAGPPPYGDRNIGVSEPYPDFVLIQNGGRFYDVQNPPSPTAHVAKGDGTTDDTAAITDAFDYLKAAYLAANPTGSPTAGYDGSNYWIYLPNGTYLVSQTLTYTGESLTTLTGGDDILRLRIVGENREKTIIRLKDSTSAFGDTTKPAVLLEFQHDGTTFNNGVASNVLTNVTIDTGNGNPGATGLWFQGANLTDMHNVLIRSSDGAGHCGLLFQTGSLQGYYRDLTVSGFDYGICQTANPEVDSALEHVTLQNQKKAGILVQGGGMSARSFAVDESTTTAEALRIEQTGAVVFLDHSELVGASSASAIDRTSSSEQALFVRDVTTEGFGNSIEQADASLAQPAIITSFASSPPVVLDDSGAPAASLDLPVEDTPLSDWLDPTTQWANVDSYQVDGAADDTAAIKAAMASGKPVVVFPKTSYSWSGTIDIPATVVRVDFMFADVTGNLSTSSPSSTPLRISYHPGYGGFTLSAQRPIVLEGFSGSFSNAEKTATKVYLENTANMGASPAFCTANESAFARSLNDEQGSGSAGDVIVNGGTLWMFGYKTENKAVTSVVASGGANVEVLNGYVNMTEAPGNTPMLLNTSSTMSYLGFTNLGSAIHGPFQNIITEGSDAGSTTLTYAEGFDAGLPKRGGVYGADFVVPLYVGHRAP